MSPGPDDQGQQDPPPPLTASPCPHACLLLMPCLVPCLSCTRSPRVIFGSMQGKCPARDCSLHRNTARAPWSVVTPPGQWTKQFRLELCPDSGNKFQNKICEKNTNNSGASACHVFMKQNKGRLCKYLTGKNWTSSKEASGMEGAAVSSGSVSERQSDRCGAPLRTCVHLLGTTESPSASTFPEDRAFTTQLGNFQWLYSNKHASLAIKTFHFSSKQLKRNNGVNSWDKNPELLFFLPCYLIWQEMDCWACLGFQILAPVQRQSRGIPKKINHVSENMVFMKLPSWLTVGNTPSFSWTDTTAWTA